MAERQANEHRLAVITGWALFGGFAFCCVVSGFAGGSLLAGLGGFALFIVGFVAHVILNGIYQKDFSAGEAALGFVVFVVGALGFIGSLLFDPSFDGVDLAIGLAGFAAIFVSVMFYMFAKYGTRGTFTLFDRIRDL
jgi:hypothetical protein